MSAARRLTSAQAQVKQKRGILSALSFSSDQPSAQLSPVATRACLAGERMPEPTCGDVSGRIRFPRAPAVRLG
jgi:hypothetical protein